MAWMSSLHSICIDTIKLKQSRPVSMTSKPSDYCCTMGGAQMWPKDSVPRRRSGATARPILRQGAMRATGYPTPLPSPSPDHGFNSDQRSASTSSSVLSRSKRSGGSRHLHHNQQTHQESGGHMKINLPVFKDKDTKNAITYKG